MIAKGDHRPLQHLFAIEFLGPGHEIKLWRILNDRSEMSNQAGATFVVVPLENSITIETAAEPTSTT